MTLSHGPPKIIYNKEEVYEALKEFAILYDHRPIRDNRGGMNSAHLFNTWYALRKLQPELVIESGVWKGLGTWMIEKAAPHSKIISLDIDYSNLKYKSPHVTYLNKDIKTYDWKAMLKEDFFDIDKQKIVIFLDDHQHILDRLEFISDLGIKHLLYEDNYPSIQGDVLSPKKILACQDYVIHKNGYREINKFSYFDYDKFLEFVKIYQELPPIFKLEKTRWGDKWDNINYSTENPLLSMKEKSEFDIFYKEADSYTWICYMELK